MAELHSPTELKKCDVFDKLFERRWGKAIIPLKLENDTKEWLEYEDDMEEPRMVLETEDVVDATGTQLNQNPAYDRNINSEVVLQIDSEVKKGKVVQRAMGPDGKSQAHMRTTQSSTLLYMILQSWTDKSENMQQMSLRKTCSHKLTLTALPSP